MTPKSLPDQRERGAVLIADCHCFEGGECWEVRCTDCGRVLEAYDDESANDYTVHWPDAEEALDDCTAHGYEWWDDLPDKPVLCGGCIDSRLATDEEEANNA